MEKSPDLKADSAAAMAAKALLVMGKNSKVRWLRFCIKVFSR